jgi:hypothetical protein
MINKECTFKNKNKHALLVFNIENMGTEIRKEIEFLTNNFWGTVYPEAEKTEEFIFTFDTSIFVCGDVENVDTIFDNKKFPKVFVIEDLIYNYEKKPTNFALIKSKHAPLNMHDVGVFFREFFDSKKTLFEEIETAHLFQGLRESNKETEAYRTGIYITPVTKILKENLNFKVLFNCVLFNCALIYFDVFDDFFSYLMFNLLQISLYLAFFGNKVEYKFNLLRCSSNFNGPTDNVRDVDKGILQKINNTANVFFDNCAELNHVLAQIYNNKQVTTDNGKVKDKRAAIKVHSDKTKDMPRNAVMAFCTFYRNFRNGKFTDEKLGHLHKSKNDPYDFWYGDKSALTVLRWRLKNPENHPGMKEQFDVVMYPNSLFLVPLSTNRIYTHEIVPSSLPVDKLPTRMGYVIRCSKCEAISKPDGNYIWNGKKYIKMVEPYPKGVEQVKKLYFDENMTENLIDYEFFDFSLNKGDYEKPIF